MWGDSSDGCLGRPPPESNTKQVSFIPLEVDFFTEKKVSLILNLNYIAFLIVDVNCV